MACEYMCVRMEAQKKDETEETELRKEGDEEREQCHFQTLTVLLQASDFL